MAFKYEFTEKRRSRPHRGWLFLVIVGYCFFAALKFFLQVEDPWPFFTLLFVLLGLSIGAYAFAYHTGETYHHGISPKGVILLSDAGFEIRGDDGEHRLLRWDGLSHIVLDERRRTLTFFPDDSLSFEFSPSDITNIDDLTRELRRYFSLTISSETPLLHSGD